MFIQVDDPLVTSINLNLNYLKLIKNTRKVRNDTILQSSV